MRRIDAIFNAERAINGVPAAERHAVRQQTVAPLVGELDAWMQTERGKIIAPRRRGKGDGLHPQALAGVYPVRR